MKSSAHPTTRMGAILSRVGEGWKRTDPADRSVEPGRSAPPERAVRALGDGPFRRWPHPFLQMVRGWVSRGGLGWLGLVLMSAHALPVVRRSRRVVAPALSGLWSALGGLAAASAGRHALVARRVGRQRRKC